MIVTILLAALSLAGVEALIISENFIAAAHEARRIIAIPSREYEGQILLGRALLEQGDFTGARAAFERGRDLRSSTAAPRLWLVRTLSESCKSEGFLCWASALPLIRFEIDMAERLEPGDVEARIDRIRYLTVAPFVVGGSFAKAREAAERLSTIDHSAASFALGFIDFHEGKHEQAELHFARSALPESLLWRIWLAQMRLDWKAAFAHSESLARRSEWGSYAIYESGRTSAFSGERIDTGRIALRSYVAKPHSVRLPRHAEAFRWLGELEEKAGNHKAAITSYRNALRLTPDLQDAKTRLAALRRKH